MSASAVSATLTQAAPYPRQQALQLHLANGELAENCADPAVLRDAGSAVPTWYLYCTTDPVSKTERDGAGWRFRLMPIYRSTDLHNWTFVTDAFATRPAPATPSAGLWAPEPVYHDGRYYLYYTITDVDDAHSPEPGCDSDSAIGVATSTTPTGPWQASPTPVVAPRRSGPGCSFAWTYDPDVVRDDNGSRYLYYGSYGGGMFVQRLSADGLSVSGGATLVGARERYEGAEVVHHAGMWYLFASSTDCCAGPLTGYSISVGRANSPEGPFLDRLGNDMAAARVGGTPLLPQDGGRWIGAGHNTVFADTAGQWWTIYHAIDRNNPYFSVADKLTRRVPLISRIDWRDGWPVIAGAQAPTARARLLWRERFAGTALGPAWQWLHPAGGWASGKGLRLPTQAADLYQDTNSASILAHALPEGDYRIEVKLRLDAPPGCCAVPVQAGLVVFRDDDNYVKLVELTHAGLRQVEFAKELAPAAPGFPRYGNTVVGTPGEWTWLRLDVVRGAGEERYTPSSSQDGVHWVDGGAWTHQLGTGARLGLVAMGGAGHHATFTSVSVSRLGGASVR